MFKKNNNEQNIEKIRNRPGKKSCIEIRKKKNRGLTKGKYEKREGTKDKVKEGKTVYFSILDLLM